MTYSAGIFKTENSSLKEASIEKLDRICRKLDLKPEDHILEIGTGWGGFAMHAAKNYGCKVTTTTISDEQYRYARKAIDEAGLQDRITLLNQDYRKLTGQYDKLVSIEMIEAVGFDFIPEFFAKCSSLLRPNGIMALQGITISDQYFESYRRSSDFIRRYIFPGADLISMSGIMEAIKSRTDMRLLHLEDITSHYARTLALWRERFNQKLDQVRNLGFSEAFIRMWNYYFAYCEGGFSERHIGDVQMVFAKPGAKTDLLHPDIEGKSS